MRTLFLKHQALNMKKKKTIQNPKKTYVSNPKGKMFTNIVKKEYILPQNCYIYTTLNQA